MGLARSTRGDSVALWLGGAESRFFYPMDPRTGGLSSPETVSRKAVETAPVACGPQPTGWQFELRIPSSRRVELGDGSSGGIKEMTARLLTQGGQVCVAEIAGASSQPLGEAPRAASGQAAEKKTGTRSVEPRRSFGWRILGVCLRALSANVSTLQGRSFESA